MLADPKNRQVGTIRDVFIKIPKRLNSRGNDPKINNMGNEFSSDT